MLRLLLIELVRIKKFCEQLLNGLNVGFVAEDITKIVRLGHRAEVEGT